MKTGLVLEGGAMRGMYTAGVIDVLMENNIYTDGAIGVSAGAVFGCNYKSRQIGRVIRYNIKYVNDPRYLAFALLLQQEIYSERIFAIMNYRLNLTHSITKLSKILRWIFL
jgi:predicted patatin/cPLA2 family phospholipase